MIIIEGPDGVGKTTVAKKLAVMMLEHFTQRGLTTRETSPDAFYAHMGKPPREQTVIHRYACDASPRAQDRWHLGMLVYGVMMQKSHAGSLREFTAIQRFLRWSKCVTVLITASADWVENHLVSKPELYSYDDILFSTNAWNAVPNLRIDGVPVCDFIYQLDGFRTNPADSGAYLTDSEIRSIFELWMAAQL